MAANYSNLYHTIWKDDFWLPPGILFKDLKAEPGFSFAKDKDLFVLPVYAVLILALRKVYSRFIGTPIAISFDIPGPSKSPENNESLEKYYKNTSKQPLEEEISALSKRLDWSRARLRRWFRRRRNKDRPSKQVKFVEASWRFLFYTFSFCFGIYTASKGPKIWKNEDFWTVFPSSFWPEVYYLYVIEGSFYVSLLYTILSDVKRKDFTVQLVHHIATLFLIYFSYAANFSRIGIIVMVLHDVSDIPLEVAKSLSYMKYDRIAEFCFSIFAFTFVFSRTIIYPFYVLRLTVFEFLPVSEWIFALYFFNGFLFILQILHIIWSSMILKMVWRQLFQERIRSDDRSDVEELSTENEES